MRSESDTEGTLPTTAEAYPTAQGSGSRAESLPAPPLTNAEWDRLFAHEARKLHEAEATIVELRAELVAAHEEIATLKRGLVPEQPFA